MREFHELTKKIMNSCSQDYEIRKWLKEKAAIITMAPWRNTTFSWEEQVNGVLGLSPKEEVRSDVADYWCEHLKDAINIEDWKFCPICGTPRPEKVKTLEDKFKEHAAEHSHVPCTYPQLLWEFAKIATEHFKSKENQ